MVTSPARGGPVRGRPAGCQPAGHGQQPVLTDGGRGEIGIAWKRFTQHRCLIKYALTVGHWTLDVVLSSGGTTGDMHWGCKSGGHSSPASGRPCRAGLAGPGLGQAQAGLGQAQAGLGHVRAGSGTGRAGHGRTDLEGAAQEPCRAGRGQERAEHGPCHGGRASAGSPRPGSARARTADALAEPRANRADRAVRARADRLGKPGHGANDPRRAHGEPDSPHREWQIQQPGQARQRARAMPVASRTDTGSGSAAAESSSRYPGAHRSGGRPASNSPDRRNCAAVASADTLISLATRVTNRWPANQRGYKDRLRELPEGRGHHAAGLGG
jgi:hypothetical protein